MSRQSEHGNMIKSFQTTVRIIKNLQRTETHFLFYNELVSYLHC